MALDPARRRRNLPTGDFKPDFESPPGYQQFCLYLLGCVDIPIGYKFSLEGVELLMREESYHLSKGGCTIKGGGFEKT